MRIQVILVPAGPEASAVRRGRQGQSSSAEVIEIPAGPTAFSQFLSDAHMQRWLAGKQIVLMGLGGSLNTDYQVADSVLLETVLGNSGAGNIQPYGCDRTLTQFLSQHLPQVSRGIGITSDHVVTTVVEKQHLRNQHQADVVDMESAVLLQQLPTAQIAILRVISDNSHHPLPDISAAIAADGSLKSVPLGVAFIKQPWAALRLIRGSLKGLQVLEQLAARLP